MNFWVLFCTASLKLEKSLWLILINKFVILLFFFFTDDYNRVVLEQIDNIPDSDYVNASYVDVSLCFTYNMSFEHLNIRIVLIRRDLSGNNWVSFRLGDEKVARLHFFFLQFSQMMGEWRLVQPNF